jgi:hypothetical protein
MELRQGPIAKRQSRQPFDHCVAIYLKLLVRKGVAGQRVHREQRAEHPAVGEGSRSRKACSFSRMVSGVSSSASKRAASDSMALAHAGIGAGLDGLYLFFGRRRRVEQYA